jgi:tripartite-type tricarboxylate transporter receptor subunit TctC
MVDLVSGQVQLAFPAPATIGPFLDSGKLRPLAVTTARRSKLFPQLPTIAEAGVPGYVSFSWYGFVVAARTPQNIIVRLNRELVHVLNMPDTGDALLS